MTFAELMKGLLEYDEEPFEAQEPAIFLGSPFAPNSEAIVEWTPPKGGLPTAAAERRLYFLTSVREAVQLLEADYARLIAEDRTSDLCGLLVQRVEERLEHKTIGKRTSNNTLNTDRRNRCAFRFPRCRSAAG